MTEVSDLLTADERHALALSGKLANLVGKIIRAGDGPTVDADWSEAARAIHVIQHMIGAQAAARAYPYEYRLLGSTIPPRPADMPDEEDPLLTELRLAMTESSGTVPGEG